MADPRILRRSETVLSQWVRLVAKETVVADSSEPRLYHSLAQADYVTVIAPLPDGRLPIVRQFRSAVERDVWEFPAGLLEPGEEPADCARRELLEETGIEAGPLRAMGSLLADTGRLENRIHLYGGPALGPPAASFTPEPGMTVALVTPARLRAMILEGEFPHQMHVGAIALAELNGLHTGVLG
jgi:ADP-ribose pyrophosphatase